MLLGRTLRELRDKSGMERAAVLTALGWDSSKLSKFESGQGVPTVKELDDLLDLFEVGDRAEILNLAAQARRRSRFGRVPDWSRQYFGLEQDARKLSVYQGELLPGLFQTETYARELISRSKLVSPADVESVVQARLKRQALLDRDDPPQIHAVVGEGALVRKFGGGEAFEEQIQRLIDVSRLPHVTLQVLPFSAGVHAALDVPFTLLTLDVGNEEARWVYLSDLTRGECRSDPKQVGAYQMTFDSLIVNALGEGETLDLLNRSRDGRQ